jgi:hypothetical protein
MEVIMGYRKRVFVDRARVIFDPAIESHLLDYAKFLKYSSWKDGCNYLLEDPYMDIPTMINEKIVNRFLTEYTEKV